LIVPHQGATSKSCYFVTANVFEKKSHFPLALSLEIRYGRECISAGSGAGVSLKGLQPRATLRHSLALVLLSAFSFFKKWGSTVRADVCPKACPEACPRTSAFADRTSRV
jgi:hypothetical protein